MSAASPLPGSGPAPEDGRTARTRRTREAVVDALLALLEEGDPAPTAQRVAQRAAVALRTVYVQFSDMETLWAAAGRRELARLGALSEPVSLDLDLADRIEGFSRSRSRTLEALMPVMRATRPREPSSPQLMRNRALFIAAGDEEVARFFSPELDRLPAPARKAVLDALYLVSSAPAWESLRHDRGLSVDEARAAICNALTALLTTARLP